MTDETTPSETRDKPWLAGQLFSRLSGFVSRHMMPLFVSAVGSVGVIALVAGLSISSAGILVGLMCISLLVLSGMGV